MSAIISPPHQNFSSRVVVKTVFAEEHKGGSGAIVRRSIGSNALLTLDPFLLLGDVSVAEPAGFTDHPHRGFETVSYVLEGAIHHEDFAGHKGTIQTGDVQWMTAGRGIVHSEMPAGEGVNKALQLWVNLSSKHKMVEPQYQEVLSKDIVRASSDGVEVRVIAGESMGVRSPIYTRTPTMFLDFTLSPGAHVHQSIPAKWTSFIYIIKGEGAVGAGNSALYGAYNVLVLGDEGEGVDVWNKSTEQRLRFVLVGGQPLKEAVVPYGPFVMNTQAEVKQALEDYANAKNGFELAKSWRSSFAA